MQDTPQPKDFGPDSDEDYKPKEEPNPYDQHQQVPVGFGAERNNLINEEV